MVTTSNNQLAVAVATLDLAKTLTVYVQYACMRIVYDTETGGRGGGRLGYIYLLLPAVVSTARCKSRGISCRRNTSVSDGRNSADLGGGSNVLVRISERWGHVVSERAR